MRVIAHIAYFQVDSRDWSPWISVGWFRIPVWRCLLKIYHRFPASIWIFLGSDCLFICFCWKSIHSTSIFIRLVLGYLFCSVIPSIISVRVLVSILLHCFGLLVVVGLDLAILPISIRIALAARWICSLGSSIRMLGGLFGCFYPSCRSHNRWRLPSISWFQTAARISSYSWPIIPQIVHWYTQIYS